MISLLAATAAPAGSYISTSISAGFLSFPVLLWVAANVIIIWLLSSSRRRNTTVATSLAGHADDVLKAVDDLYPSSEYETVAAMGLQANAPVSKSKRQGREARTARRNDRPRLRKKPAGEEETRSTAAVEAFRPDVDDKKHSDEMPGTVAAAEARPDDADVSLDSMWQSIVQRRAARPVAFRKSETCDSDELPRLQRAADTAAERRDMRKSVSAVNKAAAPPPPQAAPSAARQLGWRTREVLVMAQDELLRRAESLIRRHHQHLRLQRQESEQRQAMELQRGRPALIRV